MKKKNVDTHCVANKLLTALNVNNVKAGINKTTTKKTLNRLDKKSSFILIIKLKNMIIKMDIIKLIGVKLSTKPM